ncbi:hypothetical protein PPACK8108_LOCUS14643 [Phakopsora pachyrhizi]|uniref:Major facilitator superfamily (MFS) profile domain-containing protein n=1 Tax=Phakopsora pachyrhizi TaxID=170000 RepID=A0AAV0B6T6_PHAPC|nr:hypothetical protein PPACK8108_LOCUS14643 [Phakopsora pachyrhizi]
MINKYDLQVNLCPNKIGLQNTLGITDHQYSVALTVTYIPYIAAEMPANLLLKKIGPNIFLPTIVTLWLNNYHEGFVKSYGGLIAARFFLGLVEGGMFHAISFKLLHKNTSYS